MDQVVSQNAFDAMFEMYEQVLMNGSIPDYVAMSIDSFQEFAPEYTDEVLAELGIQRGVNFVWLTKEHGVQPGFPPE